MPNMETWFVKVNDRRTQQRVFEVLLLSDRSKIVVENSFRLYTEMAFNLFDGFEYTIFPFASLRF